MANDVVTADELIDMPLGVEDGVGEVADESTDKATDAPAPRIPESMSSVRWMMRTGLAVVVALSALVGWLGFQDYKTQKAVAQRQHFLDAAKQGALNLTTIDWQHADTDVRRIMDGATGEFYNDFANRSQPFVDVLKQAKAASVGTVTAAGLESQTGDTAQALVSVAVKTSNSAAAEQVPRAWRMRISVQKLGDQMKVSNVEFVP